MPDKVIIECERKMERTLAALKGEFARLRTGRASPTILEGVKVNAYDSEVPLTQLASIHAPDAKLLVVQPWDKANLAAVEKAVQAAGLGLNPQSDGNVLRVPIPPLSDERRAELAKLARHTAEEARVALRNVRRSTLEELKKLSLSEDDLKRQEGRVKKTIERFQKSVDELVSSKEREILGE